MPLARPTGLIDIHIHGQAGLDAMSADRKDLLRLSERLALGGVAGFLPTFISSSKRELLRCIANARWAQGREAGARILGVHLEGPFLNAGRKGTHNARHLRAPDVAEAREWLAAGEGLVRLVTLAPELPGAGRLIRFLVERGVRVSLGHSRAGFAQAASARAWGASSITHLFNAMEPLGHRQPGLAGFGLLDRQIYTELIADGVHVHDAIVRLVLRTRPADRMILVSDNFFLSGLARGSRHRYAGMDVKVEGDGSLRKADGTLAGSGLGLADIVRRVQALGVLPAAAVAAMARENPLRLLGLKAPSGRPGHG